MPNIDYKKIMLKELNTLNSQSYGAGDVSVGYSHDSGDVSKADMVAVSTGTIAGTGRTAADYHRISLQDALTASGVESIVIRQVNTVANLLPQLARYTGIALATSDIVDGNIDYDDNMDATITLTCSLSSPVYRGAGTLQLKATEATSLSAIVVADQVSFSVNDTAAVQQAILTQDDAVLDWSAITLSEATANTNSSASSRNSMATLTAKPGMGYVGSAVIYFDRTVYHNLDLPQFYTFPTTSAWTGTPWQWLNQFYPQYAVDYQSTDFYNQSFTIPSGVVKYAVPVSPVSGWTMAGTGPITVNAHYDNWIGSDTVMAFDVDNYNQAGFTDYAGNAVVVRPSAGGIAGGYPTKGEYSGPFDGGLGFDQNATIFANPGEIPTSFFAGAWTLDMWAYNAQDRTGLKQVTWQAINCATNADSTSYLDRFSISMGDTGDTTYGGRWLLYNNANSPRVTSAQTDALSHAGWMHVMWTYNGSGTLTCYVNGVQSFTITGWSIAAGSSWYTGFAAWHAADNGGAGIDRWRLRSGVKATAAFSAQDLYPQVFLGEKQALSELITVVALGTLPDDTTDSNFIMKVSAANSVSLRSADVTFTAPTASSDANGNTKITITATENGRYTGSVDVFFNRTLEGVTVVPDQWSFAKTAAFSGTALDYLTAYFPTVVSTYFSNWTTEQKAKTPTVSVVAGEVPTFHWLLNRNVYLYDGGQQVSINPVAVNWPGANTVAAWDSSLFAAAGFTDKAGNPTVPAANLGGSAGTAPILGSDTTFAYGKGVIITNGEMTTTNQLAATNVTGAFTVDFWVRVNNGTPTDAARLPYGILIAMPNNQVFTVNSRVVAGPHDVSIGYQALWNNLNTARAIATVKYTAMCQTGWHHVALTYSGAGVTRIYFDGVLVNTLPTWTILSPGAVQLGVFGFTVNGLYPSIERWRFRNGVKFAANFTAADIYV